MAKHKMPTWALCCVLLALADQSVMAARPAGERSYLHSSARSSVAYTGDALKDKVTYLPGWGQLKDFNMFSGYVTVDYDAGRRLSYIYVESSVAPDTQPLLLWLNGGPGCSSIGGGFLSELGPFLPLPGGTKLQANAHAWNRVANVLFVESPAFVGFSTSDKPSDAIVGDARTAADMRQFLLGFVQRFPHLADRPLYLSGESYAGHYVPTLAWEIIQGNKVARKQGAASNGLKNDGQITAPAAGYLNLKGLLVGNPWTDAATDNLGAVDYWWAHALISDSTALGIKANCDMSQIGPLERHPDDTDDSTKAGACDKFCNRAAFELGPINIYEIYADVCPPPRAKRAMAAFHAQLTRHGPVTSRGSTSSFFAAQMLGSSSVLTGLASRLQAGRSISALSARTETAAVQADTNDDDDDDAGAAPKYDPCVDDEVTTYLNLPEVQRALHFNVSGELPGPWGDCTREIMYSRDDLLSSMLPVWRQIIETEGLHVIIYSGDVDGIVPVVGTRRWVAGFGLMEAAAWRPWYSSAQVGGYTVEYYMPWQPSPSATAGILPTQPQLGVHAGAVTATDTMATRLSDDDDVAEGRTLLAAVDAGLAGDNAGQAVKSGAAMRGRFVFATVRGAGHMVPYVQPGRALHLLTHFLQDVAL